MYLESLCHPASSFVTLTYSPERLPVGGSLVPRDVQLWLKRLRAKMSPSSFRFFLCGEYGDQSWRPHYHAALFGVGVASQEEIAGTWSMGHVAVYEFNETTAQYIAGYVVKKMTRAGDPRLRGLHPEFARMSLRPGIGALAMEIVSEQLFSAAGVEEFRKVGDVPRALRLGRRSIPLGRYLRARLRADIGMTDEWREAQVREFSREVSAEVHALLLRARSVAPSKTVTAQSVVVEASLGKIRSMEARAAIRRARPL